MTATFAALTACLAAVIKPADYRKFQAAFAALRKALLLMDGLSDADEWSLFAGVNDSAPPGFKFDDSGHRYAFKLLRILVSHDDPADQERRFSEVAAAWRGENARDNAKGFCRAYAERSYLYYETNPTFAGAKRVAQEGLAGGRSTGIKADVVTFLGSGQAAVGLEDQVRRLAASRPPTTNGSPVPRTWTCFTSSCAAARRRPAPTSSVCGSWPTCARRRAR